MNHLDSERKQIEEVLQQRNRELALINQTTQLLTSTLELDTVLETVLSGLHNLLNIAATSFWLRIPETGELVCQHAIGVGNNTVIGWRLAEGQGLAGWAALTGESILVVDTHAEQRHFKLVDQLAGVDFRSVLSIPLRTQRGVIGVLNLVDTQVGRFAHDELSLIEPMAAAAAIAIENARFYQAAQDEISERKRVEEILREQNKELDAFAHTVAHNLKNPLSVVVGYSDFLVFDLPGLTFDEITNYCHIIKSAGKKSISITEDLLLLATVRKDEIQQEPLDMGEIVQQVQKRLEMMIKEYRGTIIVSSLWPTAVGYAPWVEEVWVNYLTNGLKYGGEPPVLELGADPPRNGMIRFWIKDNGPGLTPKAQANLFVEFNRLNEVSAPGHGLGLSIVKRIVEKLAGQVGVETRTGQGSRFYFTLPTKASSTSAAK